MDAIALHARQRLLDRRKRLVRSLELARGATPTDPLDRAPPPSGSTEALPRTGRGELATIDEALDRIEDGAYGRCLSCGGAIGGQRLTAIPEARLCDDCRAKAASSL